jgi:alpha-tubulin suppressor-like RCC1 family protein
VKAVVAGVMTCALLDDDRVKCWGDNDEAILGLGYRGNNRGDQPGEMGDSLPAIDLGTGRTATALALRAGHTCARLVDGETKCWGFNQFGQVGIGTTTDVGDEAGEMGDALPVIDLGTGHAATTVATGALHTCAVLEDASVKCWGINQANPTEATGQPDDALGDEPGEMGDALPVVDLGTNAKALDVVPGFVHTCVLLEGGQLKCWGGNGEGQLGLGVADQLVGDTASEMGDTLPTVDLGR